jgi:hypothetical protein
MRVYLSASIFMQRLAWLRLAASIGMSRSRSNAEFTSTVLAIASGPMSPREDDLAALRDYASARQAGERLSSLERVPAQDLWLSRSQISWNGSLTRDSAVDVPRWGVAFGVLRPGALTTTSVGRRLVTARAIDRDWTTIEENPFVLTPTERFFLLAALWESDGDLMRKWLPLLPVDRTFDRSAAGDLLVPALRSLALEGPPNEAAELLRFAATLERQTGEQSSRGPREHWVTSRVEQLVDLGILRKPQMPRFEFSFDRAAVGFVGSLTGGETPLDIGRALWAPGAPDVDDERAETALIQSYERLNGPTGLAEIEDLWFFANARLLFEPEPSWLAREMLDRLVRDWLGSGRATFNVDKLGQIKYVKLRSGLRPSGTS